ncbi:colicin V production protein [Nitritalea halalkaliphila LW7]|uniref:Colicin V production protein n=1 Tax=Nitritalea halalkaliphila LW7 TaxID=1189621 RepID=I5BWD5_9BACT|nr:CvpA family protein [Nitritalea halalkaliphila]EIM73887.1 colicin V production protein [Nitritalea halalkaliphila LW7]
MDWVTWVILAAVVFGAWTGFKQGLLVGIFSLVGFFMAMYLAFRLMDRGTEVLARHVQELTFFLPFVSFLILFFSLLFLVRLLSLVARQAIDMLLLGPLDRVAGALLGVFKALFVLSLLAWISDRFQFPYMAEVHEVPAYAYIRPLAPVFIQALDAIFLLRRRP